MWKIVKVRKKGCMQAVLKVLSTGGYCDRMLSKYISRRSNVMLRGILRGSGIDGYNDRPKLFEDIIVELLSRGNELIRLHAAEARPQSYSPWVSDRGPAPPEVL